MGHDVWFTIRLLRQHPTTHRLWIGGIQSRSSLWFVPSKTLWSLPSLISTSQVYLQTVVLILTRVIIKAELIEFYQYGELYQWLSALIFLEILRVQHPSCSCEFCESIQFKPNCSNTPGKFYITFSPFFSLSISRLSVIQCLSLLNHYS